MNALEYVWILGNWIEWKIVNMGEIWILGNWILCVRKLWVLGKCEFWENVTLGKCEFWENVNFGKMWILGKCEVLGEFWESVNVGKILGMGL